MKYGISYINDDGEKVVLDDFKCSDLDYWNIAQWRLLLLRFYQLHSKKFGSLIITPIYDL